MHEQEHHINTVLSKSMVCLYKYKSCGCRIPFYHNIHFTLHNNLVTYTYLFYLHIYLLTISFLFIIIYFILSISYFQIVLQIYWLITYSCLHYIYTTSFLTVYLSTYIHLLPYLYFPASTSYRTVDQLWQWLKYPAPCSSIVLW